jgi:hypothetical protein
VAQGVGGEGVGGFVSGLFAFWNVRKSGDVSLTDITFRGACILEREEIRVRGGVGRGGGGAGRFSFTAP